MLSSIMELDECDEDENHTMIMMKICGVLVNILCRLDPRYRQYVVYQNRVKILYVHILWAIYGLFNQRNLVLWKKRQER